MKKSKKLTILFSIVTISVLVAIGCSNDNSSDEPEATPAAAATEDTQTPAATTDTTTTTTTDTSSSGSEEGNEQPACDDTAPYGAEGSCQYCGNRHVDGMEVCDGDNCLRDCTGCVAGYHLVDGVCERDQETSASGCAICGDGRLDEGEDCDGTLFRDPNLPEGVSCRHCQYDYTNVIWENR